MDLCKIVTNAEELVWDGVVYKDIRVVWFVEPIARQFAVHLDEIDVWDSLTTSQKMYSLWKLWSYFQRNEASEISEYLQCQYGWKTEVINIEAPLDTDEEHVEGKTFIELNEAKSYPFGFPISGAVIGWSTSYPLPPIDTKQDRFDERDYIETLEDPEWFDSYEIQVQQTKEERELDSVLSEVDQLLVLARMLNQAAGRPIDKNLRQARDLIKGVLYSVLDLLSPEGESLVIPRRVT